MSCLRVNILFHRLGPYHHVRLGALADQCTLTAIEFSSVDDTYAWDSEVSKDSYQVLSLFTDADIDTKPVADVVRKLRSALQLSAPQVVAIPGWSSPASLAALAWCCATNTPAILMSDSTSHGKHRTCWKEWIKRRIVGLFSSALVAGKPHVDYVESLGLPRKRVFTGYDVVDNAYFNAQSSAMRADANVIRLKYGLPARYFLASNRFIKEKNLSRLLDAYANYVAQAGPLAWDLVLLGDGPLKDSLVKHVARLDLVNKVHFPGFKQYDELPIFYGLADSLVLASDSETWGLVVNEAMASGLPVLVSELCGCALDLVQNEVNGFTFDPYDIEDMTSRMLQISGNNCDLVAMGQASQAIISSWSPKTFAENMLKAAEAALASPRPHVGWFNLVILRALMRR